MRNKIYIFLLLIFGLFLLSSCVSKIEKHRRNAILIMETEANQVKKMYDEKIWQQIKGIVNNSK